MSFVHCHQAPGLLPGRDGILEKKKLPFAGSLGKLKKI